MFELRLPEEYRAMRQDLAKLSFVPVIYTMYCNGTYVKAYDKIPVIYDHQGQDIAVYCVDKRNQTSERVY